MSNITSQKFLPMCLPTGIGSLPFREIREATNFINEFYHEIPFSPQLPEKNFKKNMIVEFFQKIPLTEIKNGFPKFQLAGDDPKLLETISDFRFENGIEAEVLDFFGKRSSPGTHFKTQITGPVTMLLNVRDVTDRNLFEFPKLVEWMKKYLLEQALGRVKQISAGGFTPIIFLDEPSLAQLEPLILRDQRKFLVSLLNFFVTGLSNAGALVGLHCCGPTDWSLVFEAGFDIVSFDAVKDMGHFLGFKDPVRAHFQRGGVVAWGLIPSEYLGYELDCAKLVASFLEKVERLTAPPLSLSFILTQSLVTTSCGTAGLGLEDNRSAHRWVREVSNHLKEFVA